MITILKRENNEMVEIGTATNSRLALNIVCARLGVQPHNLQIDIKAVSLTRSRMDIFFLNDRKRTESIAQLVVKI